DNSGGRPARAGRTDASVDGANAMDGSWRMRTGSLRGTVSRPSGARAPARASIQRSTLNKSYAYGACSSARQKPGGSPLRPGPGAASPAGAGVPADTATGAAGSVATLATPTPCESAWRPP